MKGAGGEPGAEWIWENPSDVVCILFCIRFCPKEASFGAGDSGCSGVPVVGRWAFGEMLEDGGEEEICEPRPEVEPESAIPLSFPCLQVPLVREVLSIQVRRHEAKSASFACGHRREVNGG
jgi:hypothetical protein